MHVQHEIKYTDDDSHDRIFTGIFDWYYYFLKKSTTIVHPKERDVRVVFRDEDLILFLTQQGKILKSTIMYAA